MARKGEVDADSGWVFIGSRWSWWSIFGKGKALGVGLYY
jgi:hypothetical protein